MNILQQVYIYHLLKNMMGRGKIPAPFRESNRERMVSSVAYKIDMPKMQLKSYNIQNILINTQKTILTVINNGELNPNIHHFTNTGWLARRVYAMMEQKYSQKVK